MNHLPPEESKILTEKLKSVGIEVETEYGYASYELTQKIADPHRPIRRADYPRMSKVPTYTLSEMLELLPRINFKGESYYPHLSPRSTDWYVHWIWRQDDETYRQLETRKPKDNFESDTPLIAIYHALLWAIDEGYIHN